MTHRLTAAQFNELHPVGTRVNYRQSRQLNDSKTVTPTRTRSEAWVVGGSVAVVLVEGMKACLMLDALTPGCRDGVKCLFACGDGECRREKRGVAPGGEYSGKGWGKVPKALKPLAVEAPVESVDDSGEPKKTHRRTRRKTEAVKKTKSTEKEAETC